MKKLSCLMMLAVLSFAQNSYANDKAMKMDKDNDGKISSGEAQGKIKKGFDKIDANKDGFITKDELEKMKESIKERKKNKNKKNIEKMDKDNDGKISSGEAQGKIKKSFDKIDANKDGYITKDELEKIKEAIKERKANS